MLTNEGVAELMRKAYDLLKDIEDEEIEEVTALEEIIPNKEDWIIKKIEENAYELSGQVVDNVLNKYVFLGDDGIIQFLQIMRHIGMEEKLEEAGVKRGDTIIIEGYEFEYV